jgi:gluconokinase
MMSRIIIMGVSGCGKSSVGALLAARLGIAYEDGDDLHPRANVEKMRSGQPLDDTDRWPWLDKVAERLAIGAPMVIGCSALKRVYRDRIRAGAAGPVTFVHLVGDRALLAARMAARSGHYMPTSLLDSQLATLEPPGPDEAMTIGIDQPVEAMVDVILAHLAGARP